MSTASLADKAFADSMKNMMLPHHQDAVDMVTVELQYGTDPELRQLASDIVAARAKEIAQMKAWLAKNGE